MVTTRDLGEAGIKLLGVYFAASSLVSIMSVAASLAIPRIEGLPSAGELAILNALPIVGALAVAAVCLFRGRLVADRVFAKHRFEASGISRRDLLVVGLALLGVSLVAAGMPSVLGFIGQVVWYAEGSRQSQFLPSMEQSWQPLANNLLDVIVGAALVATAGRIGWVLDRRYDDVPPHDHRAG
jgi:hypothetical protein